MKKVFISVGCVILVLIITNPTPSDFKNYMDAKGFKGSGGRTYYYLIYSRYEAVVEERKYDYIDKKTYHYYGFFKNFFECH